MSDEVRKKCRACAFEKPREVFFEGTGTTLNTVAIGFVETPWQSGIPKAIHESICGKTAIHRFATVEEVADSVRLCINNPFVNGTVVEVSGGYCYK